MKNPVRQVVSRLRTSERYKDVPSHLLPYVVPGLAETLERIEPARRKAFRPQTLLELQRSVPPKEIEQHQHCPLCGHDGVRVMYRPVTRKKNGDISFAYKAGRCADCEMLYRVPGIKPTRVPDLYSGGNYSKFLDGKYLKGRHTKYKRTMKAFKPFLDKGEGRRLLDFGCGTGVFLELALERGFDAYGVDLAPDAVEVANERLGAERAWFGAPLDVPQTAEGGFDVITLWSVIAHFADPLEQLEMLRSLLNPGGVLMIYTINAQSIELKAYNHNWNCFTRNHLMFWEPATLAPMLRRAGFDGVAFRPFYPASIELNRWKFSEEEKQRLITSTDKYQNGNMMRAAAINGPAELAGIADTRRL